MAERTPFAYDEAKRNDFKLIGVVLGVALLGGGAMYLKNLTGPDQVSDDLLVVVQSPDGIVFEQPLSQDGEYLVTSDLGENMVRIKDGEVEVEWATCDNQVCVDSGLKHRKGDQIVCLPNQVVVNVVSDASEVVPIS